MAYWLVKSEPSAFSWDDLVARGKTGEPWTGVRNHTAKQNLMKMRKGERAFFYHSVEEKRIVGIVEVCKPAHKDSTSEVDTWECVDIRALIDVPKPVSLDDIKLDERLKEMVLVKNSRLSVQPVTQMEYQIVCRLGRR